MGISDKLPIRIEPGLFEWLTWYANCFPEFMTDNELIAAGYNIDTTYEPMISRDDLKNHLKENCDQYYTRNYEVVKKSLKTSEEQGTINRNFVFLNEICASWSRRNKIYLAYIFQLSVS